MKKIICMVAVIATSIVTFAQKEIFQLNKFGVCEFAYEYESADDAATLYKKAKAWLSSANMNWTSINDVQNQEIAFNAYFNTATRYNPFAGAFTQDLSLSGVFKITDNKIHLVLNNLRVIETYAGYGMKKTETTIEDVEDVLTKAGEELQVRFTKLNNMFQ